MLGDEKDLFKGILHKVMKSFRLGFLRPKDFLVLNKGKRVNEVVKGCEKNNFHHL